MSTIITIAHDKARTMTGAIRSASVGDTLSYETESYQMSCDVMDKIKEQKGLPAFDYKGGFEGEPARHRVVITITGEASE